MLSSSRGARVAGVPVMVILKPSCQKLNRIAFCLAILESYCNEIWGAAQNLHYLI